MADMYKGIPFSPQVALADSIGAADTVIKVTDITAFPDGPSYATIGTDETGETIRYAAKTTDSLSGCTRGVEGTAKSWPAGSSIARNFTNKDFESLQENIRANKSAAEAAKSTADSAVTAAGNAATAAGKAQSAAENAAQAAETAQTTADAAATAAGNAKTTADDAIKTIGAVPKKDDGSDQTVVEYIDGHSGGGFMLEVTFESAFYKKGYTITGGDGESYAGTVPSELVITVPVKGRNTTYTISSTAADGIAYSTTVTTDAYFGEYPVFLSTFVADIKVTTQPGAAITITGPDGTLQATAAGDGTATVTVKKPGEYSVKAHYEDVDSKTVTINATTNNGTYSAACSFCTLTVTTESGSTITVASGVHSLTKSSTGEVKFFLPATGTWSVRTVKGYLEATASVSATSYTDYYSNIPYIRIFGVCWGKGSSTALSRLTHANDPNGYVNVDITTEPSPAVGTGAGSSPFDNYAPWNGMVEYNVISNALSHKKGESGFSRSSNDTVVFIPEFYCKFAIVDGKLYCYVADGPATGFEKHPGSGNAPARYNAISGYYSKSGAAPLVNITRAAARTGAKNKGSKWSQHDYATWCAVWLLYLVEFADWDSQSMIGQGVTASDATAQNVGGTDAMTYHTGRAAGTDGKTQVQYRWIENPWGNVWEWIDGANFSERKAYICTNYANYADDTTTNYTAAGVTLGSTNGYVKDIGFSGTFPWAYLPTTVGGSETTYIPDCLYSDPGWRVLNVGGGYTYGLSAGLFRFGANAASSSSNASVGARLLFHP